MFNRLALIICLLGLSLLGACGGGGSDANIFNGHGIEMIILATGMQKVHTHDEYVAVADMAKVAELLVEIIRQAGSANPDNLPADRTR